ncbi:GNAT family N-acetyltransferase [Synechococcales cyanobacterium C]|uniref:GNAT family N-acetyltransferase n=1 Tax=Petrachloros mirabilis ULC683 TaxID=2781853 RepID=A0A8K1ZXS1_9CYAN|nr:GNAT family N-acetyltransferase [Petrachloros mirabilis]NCJ07139.1 GNAT family N-acetyltransferase [Petrachloros mirabilis ULC683]
MYPQIRPAQLSDIEVITDIYNEAVLNSTASYDEHPQTSQQRRNWFEQHQEQGLSTLIAEIAPDHIVGWAALSFFRPWEGYRYTVEDSIYISQAYQGKGIGTQLLGELLEQAKGMKMHVVMAGLDAQNPASLRLHQKLGFRQVGYLPEVGFKFNRWLDLVLMQRILSPELGDG